MGADRGGETRATVASVKGFTTQCANGVLILGFGLVGATVRRTRGQSRTVAA